MIRCLFSLVITIFLPQLQAAAAELSYIITPTFTYWVNRGFCSFHFVIDGANFDDAPTSKLTLVLKPWGRDAASGASYAFDAQTVSVTNLGGANVDRYKEFFVEADCNTESFKLLKATAIAGGKTRSVERFVNFAEYDPPRMEK